MSRDEIHVGDVGTVFELTIQDGSATVDVSAATAKKIVFELPSGGTLIKDASFVTDGTDGKIKYTTIADDLSLAGEWRLQAYVQFSSGRWYSDLRPFRVYPNITGGSAGPS